MSQLRNRLLALTCAAAVALSTAGVTNAEAVTAPSRSVAHPGLDRLLVQGAFQDRAIVTFCSRPDAGQVNALRDLGLAVQPMKRLPLALVAGPQAALAAAVTSGIARDVYPDEKLTYLDTPSSNVMSSSLGAAESLRKKGFTGKGVTVGVVNSAATAPTRPRRPHHAQRHAGQRRVRQPGAQRVQHARRPDRPGAVQQHRPRQRPRHPRRRHHRRRRHHQPRPPRCRS